MSSQTNNLKLYKAEQLDGNKTFNVTKMLNENWDKIDEKYGTEANKIGILNGDVTQNTNDISTLNASLSKQNRGKQWITNWDWTKPVNQRGITSKAVTALEYLIDMWKGSNITLTVNTEYVNITTLQTDEYKRITHLFESNCKLEAGKTYTLTLYAKCNNISGRAILRPCTSSLATMTCQSTYQLDLTQSTDYKYYQCTFSPVSDEYGFGVEILYMNSINDYSDIDIKGWKLEEGEETTLPNDAPTIGDEQLPKCQRYLYYLNYGYAFHLGYCMAVSATQGNAIIALPVNSRMLNPTLSYTGTFALRSGVTDIQITSMTMNGVHGNTAYVSVFVSSGLESGKIYALRATGDYEFGISSEL